MPFDLPPLEHGPDFFMSWAMIVGGCVLMILGVMLVWGGIRKLVGA